MDPNVAPDVQLFTILEQYPIRGSADKSCKNGAEYRNLSQITYTCHQNTSPDRTYRVTYDTYKTLVTLPYYTQRVTCEIESVTNEVCFCPSGFTGYLCDVNQYTKCYVNMTEPALYKGCKDKPDSDYYVYSIQGFDPCFFYDFTKQYTLKYMLQCRPVNEKGVVEPNGHPEGVGYKYSDVVTPATSGLQEGEMLYKYAAFNNETKLRLLKGQEMTFTIDFRDFKYLSQIERF